MIATKDNLLRRGIPLVCVWCPLYGVEEETVRHLFFSVGSLGEFWECVSSGWGPLWFYIVMHKCILRCLNL